MSPERRSGPTPAPEPGFLDDAEDESFNWTRFRHFLNAPLRHPLWVLLPWAALILLSIGALFVVPKKYMSSTLILVETEKVPESFIPKVATSERGLRVETVRPEILSRTRLERVLEETGPYPEIESKTTGVDSLRKAIVINISGSDGFTIEFYHTNPHKAQEVTDRLAHLFIDETIKSREQQVEGAVDFLVTQVNEARAQLENKDAAVRRYKEEHMGRLPEQLQTNLASMQMLQREAQTVEESLYFAHEKQDALARGLVRASGGSSGTGTPAAPDDLAALRSQLAVLRSRYTEEHPDVESLKARIARLEGRQVPPPVGEEQMTVSQASVTREQVERANAEVTKLEERQRDLAGRIAAVRANVEETPRTEQALSTLMRDYQKLNENYVALLSKQLEAQMSGRLEQRWKGDRFRILDPASLPERPVSPRPRLYLGLGAVLGLFVGLGAAMTAEFFDTTIKDSEDLQSAQAYPVLACIPYLPRLRSSSAR
jgi:polysaccharide biosynthesis transport protein